MNSKKLTEYFENFEEHTQEKVLLIDGHNLIYRTIFIANFQDPTDTQYLYWKYLMMNSLLSAIARFSPTKVIFAIDNHTSKVWRKKIYSRYKESRAELRKKSAIDFDEFFSVSNDFMEELKLYLPNIYFLDIPKCEGDDIIGVMVKNNFKTSEKIIISTDKDMLQLLRYNNVKLWNPTKKSWLKSLNPKKDLEIKIIMGDKGDNVPAIKPKCGIKTATKIYENGMQILKENVEYKKNYNRNKTLIDLNCIPENIINTITSEYNNYNISNYNATKFWNFLLKHKIKKYANTLPEYNNLLKAIS